MNAGNKYVISIDGKWNDVVDAAILVKQVMLSAEFEDNSRPQFRSIMSVLNRQVDPSLRKNIGALDVPYEGESFGSYRERALSKLNGISDEGGGEITTTFEGNLELKVLGRDLLTADAQKKLRGVVEGAYSTINSLFVGLISLNSSIPGVNYVVEKLINPHVSQTIYTQEKLKGGERVIYCDKFFCIPVVKRREYKIELEFSGIYSAAGKKIAEGIRDGLVGKGLRPDYIVEEVN